VPEIPAFILVFFILKKTYIQKWPRQCPSAPLKHIIINILFYHSGRPASLWTAHLTLDNIWLPSVS
jgi:hypothetical protein